MGGSALRAYIVVRLILGTLDFGTDIVQAVRLFADGHVVWGSATLAFPVLAFVLSGCSVLTARTSRGDPMSMQKFFLLTFYSLASFFEAFIESGPSLVLQLVVLWNGVHSEDFHLVASIDRRWSLQWCLAVTGFASIVFSFVSFVATALFYNDEFSHGFTRPCKFFTALGSVTFCSLYRLFLASILFTVAPYWAFGIGFVCYLVNLIVFKATRHSWESILFSYCSLFSPSGYSKDQGVSFRGYTGVQTKESISELERARINQDDFYIRTKINFIMFSVISIILTVPYLTLMELNVMAEASVGNSTADSMARSNLNTTMNDLLPLVENRLFSYLLPLGLLIISIAFSVGFVFQVKALRDATRHWHAITPHRNRTNIVKQQETSTVETRTTRLSSEPAEPGEPDPIEPSAPPAYNELLDQANRVERPPGMNKCGRQCVTCEFVVEGTTFKSQMTGKQYKFMPNVDCMTRNVIYLVTCNQCKKQYVGKTEQALKQRHYGHRREIEQTSTPLGKHFGQGCGYGNWRIQIIDHCEDSTSLRRREGYWLHELMSFTPWGLNTRDELSADAKM